MVQESLNWTKLSKNLGKPPIASNRWWPRWFKNWLQWTASVTSFSKIYDQKRRKTWVIHLEVTKKTKELGVSNRGQSELNFFGSMERILRGGFIEQNNFFAYHQTPANWRISMSSFHLEGNALQWFRWIDKTGTINGWKDFIQALNTRFRTSGFDDITGLLAKLRQSSTVQAYQEEFENLANQTEGLSEGFLVSCFVAGLKEEVRLGVQMFWPSSLTPATSLARLQEERNMVPRRSHRPDANRTGPEHNSRSRISVPFPSRNAHPPIKRLSPIEMKEWRDKGLC